jgi:catechol 2,3-dioxygenase-like lactoylglutathione lyase family enzyme
MALAAPTFLVPDVAASIRWYADQLGFRITGTFPPAPPYGYASVGRDGVELMFLCLSGYAKPDLRARRPEGIWDAYIRMSGVEAYYDSLKHAPFIHSPLIQRSYGDREFEVIDPDGYIVVFSG